MSFIERLQSVCLPCPAEKKKIVADPILPLNQARFNALSGLGTQACACIASLQQVPNTFGNYTGLLTQPRVMQFAVRYEF